MVLPYRIITKSAEETQKFGENVGYSFLKEEGSGPVVYCLWGELGSGKTTFTQGLAKGLGITSRLLSPTFIIVRRYTISGIRRTLYHLDLYRMKHVRDVEGIGFSDILADTDALVVIEWPERLGSVLPKKRTDFRFMIQNDGSHSIKTNVYG